MRCDAFERWLDDGMPASARAEALAHARECAACGSALRTAEAVEASLRMAPPAAPDGFTAAVLSRIETLERPALAGAPALPAAPWWIVIGSEPAFWVGLGLAPALLALRSFAPKLGASVTGVTEAAISAWVASATAGLSRLPALLPPLGATEWTALAAGLAIPVLWLLYRAPIWMAESWSRMGRGSSRARGSRPGSRR